MNKLNLALAGTFIESYTYCIRHLISTFVQAACCCLQEQSFEHFASLHQLGMLLVYDWLIGNTMARQQVPAGWFIHTTTPNWSPCAPRQTALPPTHAMFSILVWPNPCGEDARICKWFCCLGDVAAVWNLPLNHHLTTVPLRLYPNSPTPAKMLNLLP